MDWLKELLKAAGFDESKIDALIGDVNKELPKHFVPKSQYNEASEAKKKAEKEVADRDKQLEDLKKTSGDAAELTKKIETLQAENKAAKEKYEADAQNLRIETALKLKLAGKVHESAMGNVIAEFDKTKIVIDEVGQIKSGFDEQDKALRESKGFYYVPEDKGGGQFQFKGFNPAEGSGGAGGGTGGKNTAADFGKRLADFAKANSQTSEAQKSYFGE